MKNGLFALLLLLPVMAKAQDDDSSVTVDVLRAPSSPAFNLLGISPSAIERPTDLNAFRISVQNASNDFAKLPSDYAVEVAPASLAGLRGQTLDKYNNTAFRDVFWQSFSLSVGLTHADADDKENDDSASFTKIGFGVKFSIVRPHWSGKTAALYGKLHDALAASLRSAEIADSSNSALISLKAEARAINKKYGPADSVAKARALDTILARMSAIYAVADSLSTARNTDSAAYRAIRAAVKNFRIDRTGFCLDFAGGAAFDFPDDRFNYSLVSKAGAWLTGGYENTGNGFSALAIIRYLYQPDKIFADDAGKPGTANISTLDAGARLVFTAPAGKFSASVEGVYRSVLNSGIIQPTWRYTFNTDYDIGLNRKLTLAIGKNFDGTVTKGGNIIAALNFVAGFGSTKKVAGK